jgi:hypothetical protein
VVIGRVLLFAAGAVGWRICLSYACTEYIRLCNPHVLLEWSSSHSRGKRLTVTPR